MPSIRRTGAAFDDPTRELRVGTGGIGDDEAEVKISGEKRLTKAAANLPTC